MNFDVSKQAFPKECKHFHSWVEFISWVEAHKEPLNAGVLAKKKMSGNHPPTDTWSAGLDIDGAIRMASAGWAEGMAKAERISAPIVEKIVGQIERLDIAYDVEGNAIDIGRFVSDDPECFVRFDTEVVSSPSVSPRLITIVHNCTESAVVSAESIIRKGAHVMALIQALEFAGHRVELTVLPYWTNAGGCAVTVKQFDQPLDAALTIFALAHPAILRRLGFVYAENMSRGAQHAAGGAYGYPTNPECDADIKVHSRVGQIDLTWIVAELEKQGIRLVARD